MFIFELGLHNFKMTYLVILSFIWDISGAIVAQQPPVPEKLH